MVPSNTIYTVQFVLEAGSRVNLEANLKGIFFFFKYNYISIAGSLEYFFV